MYAAYLPHVVKSDWKLKVFGEKILNEAKREESQNLTRLSLLCTLNFANNDKQSFQTFPFLHTVYPPVSECVQLFVKFEDAISQNIPYPSLVAQDIFEYGLIDELQYKKVQIFMMMMLLCLIGYFQYGISCKFWSGR